MAPTQKASDELAESAPRLYELVGLIAGSTSEKEAQKIAAEATKIVTGAGANVTVEDMWPRRPLAYRIKHEDEAWYLILNFSALPAAMKGLHKKLRLESKLLRFLLVTMPSDYTYLPLATLEARAKEAKEGLAPGLEKPAHRAPAKAAAPVAKSRAEDAPPGDTKQPDEAKVDTKKLDTALEHLDESL